MTRPPPILGVMEVVLNVRQLDVMQRFYESTLGFAFHSAHPEDDPTIVFLTVARQESPLGNHGHPQLLALVDAARHRYTMDRYQGIDPSRSPLNHLAFEIPPEEYGVQRDRLRAMGLSVEEAAFPHMEARALFFHDPEGTLLELICHHPA